jgi:hypothetical protein
MEEQLRAFGNSEERFSKNCFFISINKIKSLNIIIHQGNKSGCDKKIPSYLDQIFLIFELNN